MLVGLAIVALHFTTTFAASAETFVVTTFDDSNDGRCDDHCSLREAVIAANEARGDGPHLIQLSAPGTYRLVGLLQEDFAQWGDLDIRSDIEIRGPAVGVATIDGTLSTRIFEVKPPGSLKGRLTLTSIVVTRSGGSSETFTIVNYGTTNIVRSNVMHNQPYGGTIKNYGEMTISDSSIAGNIASLFDFGIIENSGRLRIQNSTISDDLGSLYVAIRNEGSLELNHVTISHARRALYNIETPTATIAVTNSVISNVAFSYCLGKLSSITGSSNITDESYSTCGNSFAYASSIGLGPLSPVGGVTFGREPEQGSGVINAGSAQYCPAADQRGLVRPQGTSCDIGAVERPSGGSLPNVVVSIGLDGPPPEPGGIVSFRVSARNVGAVATDVVIQSSRSYLLDPPTLSWTCVGTVAGGVCALAGGTGPINTTVSLPPGAEVAFKMTGAILVSPGVAPNGIQPNSVDLVVVAETTFGVADADPGDNIATTSILLMRTGRSVTETAPAAPPIPRNPSTATDVGSANRTPPAAVPGLDDDLTPRSSVDPRSIIPTTAPSRRTRDQRESSHLLR